MDWHSRNLRKGRISQPGLVYLLTTITANRRPVFTDFSLARCLIQAMRYRHEQQHINSLAFVVMPDHLHWLLQLGEEQVLQRFMASFKRFTAREINRMTGESGALWQPGYHDRAMRQEENLRTMARYIVANPIRAGLVGQIGDYPHWDAQWL